ncbi:hypothetical protein [Paenibacillus darwinianus]|nr:hypothetical protein [Paenibacillus darwinianus]
MEKQQPVWFHNATVYTPGGVLHGGRLLVRGMSQFLASHGTRAFLATTDTDERRKLAGVVQGIVRAAERGTAGAECAGFHLEGPFLNPVRCGAQNPADMRPISKDELDEYLALAGDLFRLITLAPEYEGNAEYIDYLVGKGVTVSIGHSDAE